MRKWHVHPDRKREVWQYKTYVLGIFPKYIRKVVYWDLMDERGLAWPLEHDRTIEPDYISRYQLVNNGWKRYEQ